MVSASLIIPIPVTDRRIKGAKQAIKAFILNALSTVPNFNINIAPVISIILEITRIPAIARTALSQ